ncbi:hypothetical protein MHU86_20550 [Fragilaria crotonensis]|nr:hypothetical protein MHU86_20550 [Fragilaria crotonensis]
MAAPPFFSWLVAHRGHGDVVCQLLRHIDLDVNASNKNGDTALTLASVLGHSHMVCALLQEDKVYVDASGLFGWNALEWACYYGHLDVVREMMMCQTVVVQSRRCYHDAPRVGSTLDIFHELMKHGKEYAGHSIGNIRSDALIVACKNNCWGALCELLKHDLVDVNVRDVWGQTPLINAFQADRLDIVWDILKHEKVDNNARVGWGQTALSYSCRNGHCDVVRELLKHDKIDVNASDDYNYTSVIIACVKGHLSVVRQLLDLDMVNVDVNARNRDGRTALLWAIKYEYWDVVGELLQNRAVDVNVQGEIGYTFLMWACRQCRFDAVSKLLKYDNVAVDVTLKNNEGSTALDVARKSEMYEIAQCLDEYTKVCLRRREAEERSRRKGADWMKGV